LSVFAGRQYAEYVEQRAVSAQFEHDVAAVASAVGLSVRVARVGPAAAVGIWHGKATCTRLWLLPSTRAGRTIFSIQQRKTDPKSFYHTLSSSLPLSSLSVLFCVYKSQSLSMLLHLFSSNPLNII